MPEFAILTNIIHQEWSGVGVTAHKNLKGLKTENLREHNTVSVAKTGSPPGAL